MKISTFLNHSIMDNCKGADPEIVDLARLKPRFFFSFCLIKLETIGILSKVANFFCGTFAKIPI